jgi:hypothetical protein
MPAYSRSVSWKTGSMRWQSRYPEKYRGAAQSLGLAADSPPQFIAGSV